MSDRLDVTIVLDRGDATYAAGERVRGKAELVAHAPCHCRRIIVTMRWDVTGHGNPQSKEVARVELDGFDWKTAQTGSFPFELIAPEGPISYDGERFSLDWSVQAEVDLAWATDPTAMATFVLSPSSASNVSGGAYRPAGARGRSGAQTLRHALFRRTFGRASHRGARA